MLACRAQPVTSCPNSPEMGINPHCSTLFLADWDRVLMIHLGEDSDELRRAVSFPLHLWDLANWLSNRLAVGLGPPTFSLPYRFARIDFRHSMEDVPLSFFERNLPRR